MFFFIPSPRGGSGRGVIVTAVIRVRRGVRRRSRCIATVVVTTAVDDVVVMRVLIVFFIVISLMIALNPPTFIAQLMGISWGALAGAVLAPFMLGLYWRGVTPASVWACFVWGVGITVVNMMAGNPVNPINCGAIAMVGGFPVVWLVSLVTRKMKPEVVESIFECYE